MKHYLYEEQETVFSNVQILIYVFDITSDTPEEVEVTFPLLHKYKQRKIYLIIGDALRI